MTQFGSVGQLNVDVVARLDQLEKGFKDAEKRATKTGRNIERNVAGRGAGGQGLAAITQTALKAFASFSLIESGIKAATAATAAFRGEWETAAEVIKQLPLGVGPVATAIERLLVEFTPWGQAIRDANKDLERTNQLVDRIEQRQRKQVEAQNLLRRAIRESNLIGAQGFEAEFLTAENLADDKIKELQTRLRRAQSEKERSVLQRAITREEANRTLRRQDISRRIEEAISISPPGTLRGRELGRFEDFTVGQQFNAAQEQKRLDRERNSLLLKILRGQENVGSLSVGTGAF